MVQAYKDNTGLYSKYGVDKATATISGEYHTFGPRHLVEVKLDLTTLGTSPAIISDSEFFPKNARIEQVDVVTFTAATGAGAVFNLGLVKTDRTTAIDADGFIAALPLASVDTAGETTTLLVGSTYAGSSIGLTNAFPGYITADYDTAAFTAGVVHIRIYYTTV